MKRRLCEKSEPWATTYHHGLSKERIFAYSNDDDPSSAFEDLGAAENEAVAIFFVNFLDRVGLAGRARLISSEVVPDKVRFLLLNYLGRAQSIRLITFANICCLTLTLRDRGRPRPLYHLVVAKEYHQR